MRAWLPFAALYKWWCKHAVPALWIIGSLRLAWATCDPARKLPPNAISTQDTTVAFCLSMNFSNTKDPISKVQKSGYWERERFYLLDSGLQSLVVRTFLYFSKNITEYKMAGTTLYSLPRELSYCYPDPLGLLLQS